MRMCGCFKRRLTEQGITHPLAHDSYLINLASPDPVLWKKSVDSFVMEMLRADRLGIPYLVTHPGRTRRAARRPASRRSCGRWMKCIARRAGSKRSACWRTRPGKDRAWAAGSSSWPR